MKITEEHFEGWTNLEERDMGETIGEKEASCISAGMAKGWNFLDMTDKEPKRALFARQDGVLVLVCNEDGEGPYACTVS